jgi:hypothetical protein
MAYSVIDKSSSFMNTLLYTGTGASNAQTGAGFQPDMTWLKSRSATTSHYLFDSARGATKAIFPDLTDAEATNAEYLKSFDSDGFTVGTNAGINDNTATYAGWNWKAGTTSGIATNGSTTITPSAYSFNQTSGISIVQFAGNETGGAKVPHGLGAVPEVMILKALSGTNSALNGWNMYHHSIGNTKYMLMNTTDVEATATNRWNDTTPDSVNFTLGSSDAVNVADGNMVAYCFAPVKGYSKFGYFKGNGETNGPVVYCGFKPQYLIIKRYNSGSSVGWGLYDNKRNGYNDNQRTFYIQSTSAEDSGGYVDFYSTGFKLTSSSAWQNSSNNYFLYLAFGQSIVGSNGVTGTAR